MTWEYWICLYTRTHCTVRGLRASTIAAYQKTLEQFASTCVFGKATWSLASNGAACLGVRELSAARAAQRRCGREPSSDGAQELYRASWPWVIWNRPPIRSPLPEDEGRAVQAARRVVGRGSPESAGQSTEGYCSGLADRAILALLYGTGSALGVRDVDGGER